MSKITLTNVASLTVNPTTAQTEINNNFATIQTALDNTLSRDGTSPNQMTNSLDMNSFQIVNLPQPVTNNSPVRLQDLNTVIGGGTISSIPSGGTTNQVLAKNSNANYDTKWTNSVTSVGLSMPADFTITNSPVTTTGTLTASFANTPTGSGGFVRATSPTITTPVISSIVNTGTLTLPTSSDTLVGRATTDTLTNKTISGSSNTLSNIALSSHSTQAAYTLVGNATASSAAPTAFTIDSLTAKSPVNFANDEVPIWDAAGTAMKKALLTTVLAGIVVQPGGRLTLTSATPVMSSTVSGATTVYYTPYKTNMIPLYDGTNIIPTQFAELSQTTTDTTKSPAAVAATKPYDIFVWNDSGTLRATRGPAWSSDSARGYTLTLTNGILLNTSSITNGPAALRGTYVGTIRSNGSSTIDWIYGGSASGGVGAFHYVWNYYNRVPIVSTTIDSGTSYTYASSTIRQARASGGNQLTWVVGQVEDGITASLTGEITTGATLNNFGTIGIGVNSTTAYTYGRCIVATDVAASAVGTTSQTICFQPNLGVNYLSANEAAPSGTNTFDSNSTNFMTMRILM